MSCALGSLPISSKALSGSTFNSLLMSYKACSSARYWPFICRKLSTNGSKGLRTQAHCSSSFSFDFVDASGSHRIWLGWLRVASLSSGPNWRRFLWCLVGLLQPLEPSEPLRLYLLFWLLSWLLWDFSFLSPTNRIRLRF